jgi:uracil-DNA glycosylase
MTSRTNGYSDLPRTLTEASWKSLLAGEFNESYFKSLIGFLDAQAQSGKTVFPPKPLIFSALNLTPFDEVKAVILGQDPYHGPGQAHGLSFSVCAGQRLPPSLRNILKEIQGEFGFKIPKSGDLTSWARQGVLLLNTVLTVESEKPGSREYLFLVLWGSFAIKK